jgi:hypothetical protein
MGGSGGRGFRGYSPDQIRSWVDRAGDETTHTEHNARVNATLGDLLAQYNDRDVDLIGDRLDSIQQAIEGSLETTLDLRFGGSVAKHTYVDGLSDVDALAILRDADLASLTASEVLEMFAETLRKELPYDVKVSVGQIAVTVTFSDEMKIQLLPAVRAAQGLRIPTASSEEWSPVIRPESFAAKLTERNQDCAGRLVPTVKLAKAALAQLPENLRPSGYHAESLAVETFRNYSGPSTLKAMLHHFFEQGSKSVLRPIRDDTGQSLNVDSDLGLPNSRARQALSGAMDRIARRMSNADRVSSSRNWLAAIGE